MNCRKAPARHDAPKAIMADSAVMLSVDQEIEGFRIDRLIASGGLSQVWLARRGDTLVALKAFYRDPKWTDAQAQECKAYFENENRWLSHLEHPSLARRIGNFGAGMPMILLEFIPGVNLREWLDGNPTLRPLAVFYRIAQGVAQAIRYLHAQRVMHRDVAPRNVMVTPGLETRLLDLQFVREIPDCSVPLVRAMSNEIGDWAFAAPELMDHLDDRYDERVDIYSLGAVLIEVLVGRPPRRRSPIESRPDVPRELSETLWAMVDERPENRPSWDRIAAALNLP